MWCSVLSHVSCPCPPPSLSSLHCPDSPFFSHTTLFSTWMPKNLPTHDCLCRFKSNAGRIRRPSAAWSEQPRLIVAKYRSWNVEHVRRRSVFTAQSPRQYENWRGMASVWGPGSWIRSRYAWGGQTWPIAAGSRISSTNHTVEVANKPRLT